MNNRLRVVVSDARVLIAYIVVFIRKFTTNNLVYLYFGKLQSNTFTESISKISTD